MSVENYNYEQVTEDKPVEKKKSKVGAFFGKFFFKLIATLCIAFGLLCFLTNIVEWIFVIFDCQFCFANNDINELIVILGVLIPGKLISDLLYCLITGGKGIKEKKQYVINRVTVIIILTLILGVIAVENNYITKNGIQQWSLLGMNFSSYDFDDIVCVEAVVRDDGEFYYVIDLGDTTLEVNRPEDYRGLDMDLSGYEKLEKFDRMLVNKGVIKFIDYGYYIDDEVHEESEIKIMERILSYLGEEEMNLDESDNGAL